MYIYKENLPKCTVLLGSPWREHLYCQCSFKAAMLEYSFWAVFKSGKIVSFFINLTNLGISFLNPTEFIFPHLLWECYLVNYIPAFVVGKLPGKLLHMILFSEKVCEYHSHGSCGKGILLSIVMNISIKNVGTF